jgi:hypothetical protein
MTRSSNIAAAAAQQAQRQAGERGWLDLSTQQAQAEVLLAMVRACVADAERCWSRHSIARALRWVADEIDGGGG